MSAFGMKPTFTDYAGYKKWRSEWKDLYAQMSQDIRSAKYQVKAVERKLAALGWNFDLSWNGKATPEQDAVYKQLVKLRNELPHKRIMGRKLMGLLEDAKVRWQGIKDMKKGVAEQRASFPLEVGEARNIDFHFNKKHLEFDFIPMWTLKAKGKTYYVDHVDCEVPWTTRETPDNATTKGAIRIKKGMVRIDESGLATITAA